MTTPSTDPDRASTTATPGHLTNPHQHPSRRTPAGPWVGGDPRSWTQTGDRTSDLAGLVVSGIWIAAAVGALLLATGPAGSLLGDPVDGPRPVTGAAIAAMVLTLAALWVAAHTWTAAAQRREARTAARIRQRNAEAGQCPDHGPGCNPDHNPACWYETGPVGRDVGSVGRDGGWGQR